MCWSDSERHYVPVGTDITVKPGQMVEAGDLLTAGIPVPAQIVQHKGIGEGRRYFADSFRKAYQDAGLPADRRNVEILARGLIDHVRLTKEHEHYIPDDVVSYTRLEKAYRPREGHEILPPKRAR